MLVTSCRTKQLRCIIQVWSSTWWNKYRHAREPEQYCSTRTNCPTSWATTATTSPYCFRTAAKKLSAPCQISWCVSGRLNTCCSTTDCSATHTSFLGSTCDSDCLESFIYGFKCIWDVEEIPIPTFLWSRCLTLALCHVTFSPCLTPVFCCSDQSRPFLLSSANSQSGPWHLWT